MPERLAHLLDASPQNSLKENQINDQEIEHSEIEQRLKFWCQVAAKGDWNKFQKRLVWDGLSLDMARLLVSTSAQTQVAKLPAWTRTLARVMETAECLHAQHPQTVPDRAFDRDRPVPFEDFYLPCLQVARQLLQEALAQVEEPDNLLSEDAQVTLERQLLSTLGLFCAPTLMQEFTAFRSTGNALRDFLLISVQGFTKRDRYQAFLSAQLQDGFRSLLEEYSVLGRLIATTIEFWVESTAELRHRLAEDWSEIQRYFSPDQSLTQVVAITAGLSDPHKGGRSVAILSFDTGMKLVYKPKDLALEVAFGNLLNWCNHKGINIDFKFPKVLNHSTHGWVEFIDTLSCQTEEAIHRFYQRSGMLMCLIHVLEGTDCHYENLIANGEYPVLIDMETLLHPKIQLPGTDQNDGITQMAQKLESSVLRTSLLPLKELTIVNDSLSIDLSGLGKIEEQTAPRLFWKHINTDGMTVDYQTVNIIPEVNLPKLNDAIASPELFIAAIMQGFEQMYRWLMDHQDALLAADSPLLAFAHQECRLLFRNTRTYGAILLQSYEPELMKSGMARSIGLDVLSRAFVTSSEKPIFWAILSAEKQAMEQLDIPLLAADTSSPHLHLADSTTLNLFKGSSFEAVVSHIQSLDPADLMFQLQVIQFSLCSRFLEEPKLTAVPTAFAPAVSSPQSVQRAVNSTDLLSSDFLQEQATEIAHLLQRQAIAISDRERVWLGMGYQHRYQSFHVQSLGFNLYDGCSGIALLFGALAKVSGDSKWRDLSLMTLHSLHQFLETLEIETGDKLVKQIGIGGGNGLASLVYTLTRLSQWLDQPELQEDALRIATLITPAEIAADRTFDVVGGTAGTLLSLLSLLDCVGADQYSIRLEQAILCGQQLLDHQTGSEGCPRAWKTWRNQEQLTGFSQGAAGIAYALLRLFAITQESRWLEAATEAIAYEQTQFSPAAQNWADLRSPQPAFQISWAHGAPGIALARLGGLSVLDTPSIRQQIAIGLDTTQNALLWGSDPICWGNFGRIETLVVAAQKLNRPDLLSMAHQATASVLAQAQAQGGFNLSEKAACNAMNPGFFHGLSGIGYHLLRLAYPTQLPSILLWE